MRVEIIEASGVGRGPTPGPTFGILSTYPPTACGLATFSAALATGLTAGGAEVRVVQVLDSTDRTATTASSVSSRGGRVVGELVNGSPASMATTIDLLDDCDVVVVQHEYGLYGGADGDEVVAIVRALRVPTIVIAHTVLVHPTAHQRSVLEDVVDAADVVVVMSAAAEARLCAGFRVDPTKVMTIPHGAAVPAPRAASSMSSRRPTLLTWGLVGPGKGIERVIDAVAGLQDLARKPRYMVAGRTHPKVLAAEGESYRNARIEQAWRAGVAGSITFDDSYRDVPSLTALIQDADVVVLPYDSTDQATSGVLVDAIAAGRPVVATAFPHAVELLASGAGVVVDHDDPAALTDALRVVLTEPGVAESMAAEAARLAPSLAWDVVSAAYIDLASRLLEDCAAYA